MNEFVNTKMPKFRQRPFKNDLNGKRFGQLSVGQYMGHSGSFSYWACQCDCGNKEVVKGARLLDLTKDSCFRCRFKVGQHHKCWKGYEGLGKELWTKYRRGAESRNIPFDIDIKHGWDVFLSQDKQCALTGVPLTMPIKSHQKKLGNASLDRLDSTKGYIEGNIQWIHKAINHLKSDVNNDLFILICNLIASRHKSPLDVNYFIDNSSEMVKTTRNLKRGDNHLWTKKYRIIYEDGRPSIVIISMRRFCKENGLSEDGMRTAHRFGRYYRGMTYEVLGFVNSPQVLSL